MVELQRFAEWLERHAAACATPVATWMVSSLPVPAGLLALLWPDEAWQAALRDVVVVGERADETVRLTAPVVTMPHPVLLPGLEELRAFAAESGIVQGVEQIHRATWQKPAGTDGRTDSVTGFAGAEYRSDAGRIVTARVGMSDPCTEEKAWTGGLTWHHEDQHRSLPLSEVGPVAWSEGMRMAAALHADRTVPPDEAR